MNRILISTWIALLFWQNLWFLKLHSTINYRIFIIENQYVLLLKKKKYDLVLKRQVLEMGELVPTASVGYYTFNSKSHLLIMEFF